MAASQKDASEYAGGMPSGVAKKMMHRMMSKKSDLRGSSVRGIEEMTYAAHAVQADDLEADIEAHSERLLADNFKRRIDYTAPRTIQLNTKYEGAVTICVWTGYAVKIVSKTGEQRVVVGPKTALLEYDETVEVFELSAGRPKGTKDRIKDVYLRVKANKVSDIVDAETKDFVRVRIPVSYRVDFEGDSQKWFDVENYVKFLTDHLRSFITNVVKRQGIEEFHANYIDFLRDQILGTSKEGTRKGRKFEENGMCVYDVEFGQLEIGDETIAGLLQESQHESVRQTLSLASGKRELEVTQEQERIKREMEQAKSITSEKLTELRLKEIDETKEVELLRVEMKAEVEAGTLSAELGRQDAHDKISSATLTRRKGEDDQKLAVAEKESTIRTMEFEKSFAAIQDKLIEALIASGNSKLADTLARNLPKSAGGLGLILGAGGMESLKTMFKGTPMAKALGELIKSAEE